MAGNTQGQPTPPPLVASGSAAPGTLYLIPCWLEDNITTPLPAPYLLDAIKQCSIFFVENQRSARRYLKSLWKEMVIDNYEWHPIHKAEEEVKAIFKRKLKEGATIGLISEAGCPGIADPGQLLTEAAHQSGATVKPLVGPSSILLALMASGLNGQQFRFTGYLPVDNAARAKTLRDLEAESQRLHCTMLFIETPYRNNQVLEAILSTLRPTTRLSIAANLTAPNEYIRTLSIADWRKLPANTVPAANTSPVTGPATSTTTPGTPPNANTRPDLHKQPAIFSILA